MVFKHQNHSNLDEKDYEDQTQRELWQTIIVVYIRDLRIGNFRLNQISGYDSNSNRGVIDYVFNDEQRCVDTPGSSNNIARVYALATQT